MTLYNGWHIVESGDESTFISYNTRIKDDRLTDQVALFINGEDEWCDYDSHLYYDNRTVKIYHISDKQVRIHLKKLKAAYIKWF